MDKRVEIAIESMLTSIKEPKSLAEIANQVHLSISHFSWLFKLETGQSPGRYFMFLRMHRASELLANSTRNIKQIMDDVGFTDKSDFVRSFKKAFCISPSRYREHRN